MTRSTALLAVLVLTTPSPAGPKVDVVVGPDAAKLERFAARELAGQLRQLFEAEVTIGAKVPAKPEHLILLGSPATNPAVERMAGKRWPKLSEQGHLLRSIDHEGRKALVVGGGSPVATLWAVYELGHHFGRRYFLHGDVPPAKSPEWRLDKLDIVMEPILRHRAWRTIGASPVGLASWGLADQKRLLRQLAKLKFNRVVLEVYPWQPFVQYRFGGDREKKVVLWPGPRFPVDGDTAGRHAFGGARVFDNPDFVDKQTYEERITAGSALAAGIIDEAHELGMTAALALAPQGPGEFEPRTSSARLEQLLRTQVLAHVERYSRLDAMELGLPPGKSELAEVFHQLLADARLFHRKDGTRVEAILGGRAADVASDRRSPKGTSYLVRIDSSPGPIAASDLLARVPAMTRRYTLVLPLAEERVLPRLATSHLHAIIGRLQKSGWEGYSVKASLPGDLTPSAHFLARASFDVRLTPKDAYDDLVTPICGEGVVERVGKGFSLIEQATDLIDRNDPTFAAPVPDGVMKHYIAKDVPPWWKEARKLYAGAMDEMYRGQQRAPGRVRPLLVYHAKRLEFAIGYLDSLEALRLAAQAKAKGDRDKQVAQLEKATEAMYNALSALGEVARDQSDRGVIAVFNAYGYRPLKAELEKAEK